MDKAEPHKLSLRAGWTDERTDLAKQLWKDGLSAAQISRRLGGGLSRNAVIGKLHRLGLARPAPSKPGRTVPAPRPGRLTASRPKPKLVVAGNGAVMQVPHAPPPRIEIPTAGPLPGTEPRIWISRAFGECAFPVGGEGADTLSCCAPTDGKAYCARHHALMHQPARSETRKAGDEKRRRTMLAKQTIARQDRSPFFKDWAA